MFTKGKDTIIDYEQKDVVELSDKLVKGKMTMSKIEAAEKMKGGDLVLDFGKHELTFEGGASLGDINFDL